MISVRNRLIDGLIAMTVFLATTGVLMTVQVATAEPAQAATDWVRTNIGAWNCLPGYKVDMHLTSYIDGEDYGSWKAGSEGWWKLVPLNQKVQVSVKIFCRGTGANWWRGYYTEVWADRWFTPSKRTTTI